MQLFADNELEDASRCIRSAILGSTAILSLYIMIARPSLLLFALAVTKHDTKLYIMLSKIYRKLGDLDGAYSQIMQVDSSAVLPSFLAIKVKLWNRRRRFSCIGLVVIPRSICHWTSLSRRTSSSMIWPSTLRWRGSTAKRSLSSTKLFLQR